MNPTPNPSPSLENLWNASARTPQQWKPAPATDLVDFAVAGPIGLLRLNRIKAINALTTAMCAAIHAQLDLWASDDSIAAVQILGAGERGFCSGGDVRAVRELVLAGDHAAAMNFFRTEYAMNKAIAHYPKPIQSIMFGVTMGGGLGVAAHCSSRVISADAKIAMPETIIGFFPDVGISWQLAHAPGNVGVHAVLTGCTMNAADAIALGLADHMLEGQPFPDPTIVAGLSPESGFGRVPQWVQECYGEPDPVAIVTALQRRDEEAARDAAAAIEQRSPLAVHVALEAIRRVRTMSSVDEVLAQDETLAKNSLLNPDFLEGVRAQLVDKDRQPCWRHTSLAAVPAHDVAAMFE